MTQLSDTHSDVEDLQLTLIRKTPSWRRAHMLGQMYETMKHLSYCGLR